MVKILYNFVKIPLEPHIKNKYPLVKNFGVLDQLYLELIENKARIKPEFVGKFWTFKNNEEHDKRRREFNIATSRTNFEIEDELSEVTDYNTDEETENEETDSEVEFDATLEGGEPPQIHVQQPQVWSAQNKSIEKRNIPSLSDLKTMGKYNKDIPTAVEDSQEDKKRELLFKFEILKKSYKEHASKIPDYTVHTPLEQLENMYEITKKHLRIDDSVNSDKKKLIFGFMFTEWVLGRFFKLDMEGFARNQIVNIDNYDKLLFELGEKKHYANKKEWSVEVRLSLMILFNAATFLVSKMLSKGNIGMFSEIIGMLSGHAPPQQAPRGNVKRKMRGPDIDINDLPATAN